VKTVEELATGNFYFLMRYFSFRKPDYGVIKKKMLRKQRNVRENGSYLFVPEEGNDLQSTM
jgi:hypothetical protein